MGITKIKYNKKNSKQVIYYRAEVFVKGIKVSCKSFSKKQEADLWHTKEKETLTLSPSSINNKMSFKECIDKFWKDAQQRMIISTLQSYEPRLKYLYQSPLADVKMSELKGIKIVEWIQWLKKHPTTKNKGRKHFKTELTFLRTILHWYKDYLNEDYNVPVTKKHREMIKYKQTIPRRPDYYMKPEDAKIWVEWLKEHRGNPVYYRLATFMLLTGTRVSEACGLKWNSVDFKNGHIRIVRRVRWDQKTKHPFLEDATKTLDSVRVLPLAKKLQEMLLEIKEESLSEVVFTSSKNELLKYNAIQSAFNAGFVALNLPWRSTHILRHTYATIALMETRNLSAVQASLGHTDQKITQRYAKTIALMSSEAGEKTSSAIFKDSKKS